MDPYINFKNNILILQEAVKIFPRIIDAFSLIYEFIIEELENDPDKKRSLRDLSFKIRKCIDPSAKKIDPKNLVQEAALIGAKVEPEKYGILAGAIIGFLLALQETLDGGENPKIARDLLKQKITEGSEQKLILKLCYVHQVTIFEVYLRDTLTNALSTDDKVFKKFIKKYKRLRDKKFRADQLYELKKIILEEYIGNHVFHKIESDTRAMYLAAFDVDLLKYKKKKAVLEIVKNRHDIIHRNSIGKDGKEIVIKISDLEKSLDALEGFVDHIEGKLIEKGIKIQ